MVVGVDAAGGEDVLRELEKQYAFAAHPDPSEVAGEPLRAPVHEDGAERGADAAQSHTGSRTTRARHRPGFELDGHPLQADGALPTRWRGGEADLASAADHHAEGDFSDRSGSCSAQLAQALRPCSGSPGCASGWSALGQGAG